MSPNPISSFLFQKGKKKRDNTTHKFTFNLLVRFDFTAHGETLDVIQEVNVAFLNAFPAESYATATGAAQEMFVCHAHFLHSPR